MFLRPPPPKKNRKNINLFDSPSEDGGFAVVNCKGPGLPSSVLLDLKEHQVWYFINCSRRLVSNVSTHFHVLTLIDFSSPAGLKGTFRLIKVLYTNVQKWKLTNSLTPLFFPLPFFQYWTVNANTQQVILKKAHIFLTNSGKRIFATSDSLSMYYDKIY